VYCFSSLDSDIGDVIPLAALCGATAFALALVGVGVIALAASQILSGWE
jgi:hypothetical protein